MDGGDSPIHGGRHEFAPLGARSCAHRPALTLHQHCPRMPRAVTSQACDVSAPRLRVLIRKMRTRTHHSKTAAGTAVGPQVIPVRLYFSYPHFTDLRAEAPGRVTQASAGSSSAFPAPAGWWHGMLAPGSGPSRQPLPQFPKQKPQLLWVLPGQIPGPPVRRQGCRANTGLAALPEPQPGFSGSRHPTPESPRNIPAGRGVRRWGGEVLEGRRWWRGSEPGRTRPSLQPYPLRETRWLKTSRCVPGCRRGARQGSARHRRHPCPLHARLRLLVTGTEVEGASLFTSPLPSHGLAP